MCAENIRKRNFINTVKLIIVVTCLGLASCNSSRPDKEDVRPEFNQDSPAILAARDSYIQLQMRLAEEASAKFNSDEIIVDYIVLNSTDQFLVMRSTIARELEASNANSWFKRGYYDGEFWRDATVFRRNSAISALSSTRSRKVGGDSGEPKLLRNLSDSVDLWRQTKADVPPSSSAEKTWRAWIVKCGEVAAGVIYGDEPVKSSLVAEGQRVLPLVLQGARVEGEEFIEACLGLGHSDAEVEACFASEVAKIQINIMRSLEERLEAKD